MTMLDPEEEILFKEKEEIENPKEDTDDCFIPAKLAEPFDPNKKITVRGYNGQSKDFEQQLVIRVTL